MYFKKNSGENTKIDLVHFLHNVFICEVRPGKLKVGVWLPKIILVYQNVVYQLCPLIHVFFCIAPLKNVKTALV